MEKRALVVGGGIAGLASAIGLCRAGWRVSVRERAAGLPTTGTALGIWPAAVRALDRLGIGDTVRERGVRQRPGLIRRPDGRRVATLDTVRLERRQGESVYLVRRPDLLAMLHQALPDGVVRFAAPVTDPNAARSEFDVVIGADGIHSRVRAEVFGVRHGPRFSGLIAWRGVTDAGLADVVSGGETWDPDRKFGYTPLGSGLLNWYAVLRRPEDHVPPRGDTAELRENFAAWHDPIPRLLDRLQPAEVLRHPLYHVDPPLPSYVRGNVALLGDAAHAMPPDLGRGACESLVDGLTLSECLIATSDAGAALRDYDARRRAPSQRIAAMSLRASRVSLSGRCTGLRDLVARGLLAVITPGG